MSTKSDFMAAEEIKGILHGREKGEQERIMRWVNESLGLSIAGGTGITPPVPAMPALSPQVIQLPTAPRSKDIKSFVTEKKPKSDVQFAAVVAYFYRFGVADSERKESITGKDLNEAGRHARGFGFRKPSQTLNNGIRLGYFDRAAHGSVKLNAVGENLVAMTLPGSAVAGGDQSQFPNLKRRKKRQTKRGKRQ